MSSTIRNNCQLFLKERKRIRCENESENKTFKCFSREKRLMLVCDINILIEALTTTPLINQLFTSHIILIIAPS